MRKPIVRPDQYTQLVVQILTVVVRCRFAGNSLVMPSAASTTPSWVALLGCIAPVPSTNRAGGVCRGVRKACTAQAEQQVTACSFCA